MSAATIAPITFACTFGCAMGAAYLGSLLPPPHFTKESQDIVRLGMGLVATMTAPLLGIVTALARSSFDEHGAEVKNSAINVLTLDRHLARCGPETRRTRELIKQTVAFRVANTWPTGGPKGQSYGTPLSTAAVGDIENQILALTPQHDTQRWFRTEALRLTQEEQCGALHPI